MFVVSTEDAVQYVIVVCGERLPAAESCCEDRALRSDLQEVQPCQFIEPTISVPCHELWVS